MMRTEGKTDDAHYAFYAPVRAVENGIPRVYFELVRDRDQVTLATHLDADQAQALADGLKKALAALE